MRILKAFGLLLSEYKGGSLEKMSVVMKCDNAGVFCVIITTTQITILPAPSLLEVEYLRCIQRKILFIQFVHSQQLNSELLPP